MIDTGIDGTHPDLTFGAKVVQNVKVGPDVFGAGTIFVEDLANTDTTSGHGTHVASTAAGTAGAFSPSDPVNVASRMAHDAGLVVTFAAGNSGPDTNTLNPYCVAPWVICVAAGLKDGTTLADFSSCGIPGDSLYHPTITAPGIDVVAARATTGIVFNTFFVVDLIDIGTDALYYAPASGTSMATPHVSGTVALMLEANPALTPDQVKSTLEATVTPMPGYAPHEVGTGFLNAYGAVATAQTLPRASTALAR